MSLEACKQVTNGALDELGVPSYLKRSIKYSWNRRLTRTIAYAAFDPITAIYSVDLSHKIFPYLTLDEKVDTYIHEACHLADFMLNPNKRPNEYRHKSDWRRYMILLGCKPTATCKIKNPKVLEIMQGKRQKTRYIYTCECEDNIHKLSRVRHKRVVNNISNYRCESCSSIVKYSGNKSIFT